MKKVKIENCNFNDFYHCIDEHGTLLGRWMDNGLVFCVSTLHHVGKTIMRTRKRPRKTVKNMQHVDKVWGDGAKKDIHIPSLIDDYNHWMGGVDLADQRIAYYHPNLRCRRNWIPMFIQIMSIIRSNSYIIHKDHFKTNSMGHKKFTLHMIYYLMNKAHSTAGAEFINKSNQKTITRAITTSAQLITTPAKILTSKRRCIADYEDSTSLLSHFPQRNARPIELHHRIMNDRGQRGSCIWCSMLYLDRKNNGYDVDYSNNVKRTSMICAYCTLQSQKSTSCYLCKKHFNNFHDIQ